jgi:hypothetical protein
VDALRARRGPISREPPTPTKPIFSPMQDFTRDFSTGDFKITIEAPARLAFMQLDRDTAAMSATEMVELSRRLASTRRALTAAGYQVRYIDQRHPRRPNREPRPDHRNPAEVLVSGSKTSEDL